MKRRILHVINNLKTGGAASLLYYTLSHLQHLPDHRFDVAVLFEEGPFAVAFREKGISVTRLGFRPRWNPLTMFRLVAYLGSNGYDLVHVHLFPAGLFVAMASVLFPHIPLVYTEHNVWNRRRGSKLWKPIDGFMYGRYHKILAVSNEVARKLTARIPAAGPKITILPNAVQVSRFGQVSSSDANRLREELSIAPTSRVLLFVGRLTRAKGLDVLLDAFSMLEQDAVLLIAGDGPLRDELFTRAYRKNIEQRARFLGFRKDIPKLLMASDMFVLPSRWEGIPIALLEAMACGKPIAASGVGGITEVIDHGRDGLLVSPGDVDALHQVLRLLLNDHTLAERLGRAAKSKAATQFSVGVVEKQLLDLYEEIIETCKSRREVN